MRAKVLLGLITVAVLFFSIGRTSAGDKTAFSQKTHENLSTAMHGEAFAYAKYLLYAHHARRNGHPDLADLFQRTARVERFQHFAEEAELAGIVGTDEENLKDAIKGESYEVETMYRDFADQAKTAGDKAAAERFEEVRRDETGHRDAFIAALKKIEPKAAAGR